MEGVVSPKDFMAQHVPALEADEARHNLILSLLGRMTDGAVELRTWSLGGPGACALQTAGWPIVLGNLKKAQCRALAKEIHAVDYSGIVGPDQTALWTAEQATALGADFEAAMPQQIHALKEAPRYPGSAGQVRLVCSRDAETFADWMIAFAGEVAPHDPEPGRERLCAIAEEGRHSFWIVDEAPVSLAGIARQTRSTAAINAVYTPPGLTCRERFSAISERASQRLPSSSIREARRFPRSDWCVPTSLEWNSPKFRVASACILR